MDYLLWNYLPLIAEKGHFLPSGHAGQVSDQCPLGDLFFRATAPEDMESKYVRMVTCSLLAVRKLLQSLPPEQVSALTDQLKSILEDPKFWKHGKHKVNMVGILQ